MSETTKYDAVIIGAGIGGLTAACLLSSIRKVLVLERGHSFGGYCSTFQRGKFKFESCIHAINAGKEANSVFDILKRCGVITNIKFLKPKNLYRAIFPEHDFSVAQMNLTGYLNMLIKFFPRETAGIKKLFLHMHNIFIGVKQLNQLRTLGKDSCISELAKASLEDLLDKYVSNAKLKAIISQYWMYCGLPPSRLSAVNYSYIAMDYLLNGGYCVEGGTQNLVNILVKKIIKNGGQIYTDHEVKKILVNNNMAVGVETKNGMSFFSDNVISGIDLTYTLEHLTERSGKVLKYLEWLKTARPSMSVFKVYLGLNTSKEGLGISDYEIFFNSSYNLETSYNEFLNNDAEQSPFGICIHSNADAGFCDKKNSVVSIATLSNYDYWASLSEMEYRKKKDESMNILIKRARQVIPNINNYIETSVAATPITMERYTANHKGAAYGWNKDTFFNKGKYARTQTPIKGLYLASNWTKLGGGVQGVMRSALSVSELIKNDTSNTKLYDEAVA